MLHCHGFLVKTLQCHEMSQPYVKKRRPKKGISLLKLLILQRQEILGLGLPLDLYLGFLMYSHGSLPLSDHMVFYHKISWAH